MPGLFRFISLTCLFMALVFVQTMVLCPTCDCHLPYPEGERSPSTCPRCHSLVDVAHAIMATGRTSWHNTLPHYGGGLPVPTPGAGAPAGAPLVGIPVSAALSEAALPVSYAASPSGQAPPGASATGTHAAPALPAGWEERYDSVSRRSYYVNHHAQTTQWERPVSGASTLDDDAALRLAMERSTRETHAAPSQQADEMDADLLAAIEASKATAPASAAPAGASPASAGPAVPALQPPPGSRASTASAPPPAGGAAASGSGASSPYANLLNL